MNADYKWAHGVVARCRCGKDGTWQWTSCCLVVIHSDGYHCDVNELTPREERGLRQAVARRSQQLNRGRRGYRPL